MIKVTDFKMRLGEYFTAAMHEPVLIKRHAHEAVLLSKSEYERLQAFEDAYWLQKAMDCNNEYLSSAESMEILKNALG